MAWVEKHLLDEIRQQIDRPETFQYIAQKYNELMRTKHGAIPRRLIQIDEAIAGKERAVGNFLKFIAEGNFSDSVSRALAESESALKTLKAERNHLRPQVESRVYVTPLAIKERLLGLDQILAGRTVEANNTLKRLFPDKITMTPHSEHKRGYVASAALNLYALKKFTNHVVGVP